MFVNLLKFILLLSLQAASGYRDLVISSKITFLLIAATTEIPDETSAHTSSSSSNGGNCNGCGCGREPGFGSGNGNCLHQGKDGNDRHNYNIAGGKYGEYKPKADHTCFKNDGISIKGPPPPRKVHLIPTTLPGTKNQHLYYYEGSTLRWRSHNGFGQDSCETRKKRIHVIGQLWCGKFNTPAYGVEAILRIDFVGSGDWTVDKEITSPDGTFALQWFVPEHRGIFFRAKNHGCSDKNNEIRINIDDLKKESDIKQFDENKEDLVLNLGRIDLNTDKKTTKVNGKNAEVIPKTKYAAEDPNNY